LASFLRARPRLAIRQQYRVVFVTRRAVAFGTFHTGKPYWNGARLQSFNTARRSIQGFETMLWLKDFGFSGAWTVCEQNHLLAVCFGLPVINKT